MTKEEIIEILNKYSRYIDRSAFDKAVLHFQFNVKFIFDRTSIKGNHNNKRTIKIIL